MLLLIAVAVLFLIVTVGGWKSLEGVQIISIAYALICLLMAYYVARWNRGVLPVAAGLAIIFGIVAVIAGPQWFYRDHAGYHNPGLPPSLLGLLTLIIVPVEFLSAFLNRNAFSDLRQAIDNAQQSLQTGAPPAPTPAHIGNLAGSVLLFAALPFLTAAPGIDRPVDCPIRAIEAYVPSQLETMLR